jgi:hypothetical protein
MSLESGNTYALTLGLFAYPGTLIYYIRAQDGASNQSESPPDMIMVQGCFKVYLPLILRAQ